MHAALLIFAGLGLFFVGVKLVSAAFSQMAGLRLRSYLRAATSNPLKSASIGALGGALTQSTNAITFIVTGLISSGTMTIRQGLPIIAWANIGTSVLVFIATINTSNAVMLLIGVVGLCYFLNLDKKARYRHMVSALLGVALLMLGLSLIKDGSSYLRDYPWVAEVLLGLAGAPVLAFLTGALLTPIVQTAKTVATVAVALVASGLLTLDQTIMIVLGANLASCINIAFMGSAIQGTSRQAAYYQGILKIAGVVALLPVFASDYLFDYQPGLHLLALFSDKAATQIAVLYLLLQIAAYLVLLPFEAQLLRLLARLAPATAHETLSRPRFISDECLKEPATGMDLASREQDWQVEMLPAYLSRLRDEKDEHLPDLPAEPLRDANAAVMQELSILLRGFVEAGLPPDMVEGVVLLQNRQELVRALQDNVFQFATHIRGSRASQPDHEMIGNLVEALHLTLTLLPSALSGDEYDRSALMLMTSDKSEMMEGIRRSLLRSPTPISPLLQDALFTATTLYERIIWLVRRMVILTGQGEADSPEKMPDAHAI
ncbi:MAG: Na/Pi symporter [Alphaproteobacteria bacterium]|nr:Na/Pi symporter [Alphaproteobacteria bacterium]MBU0797357.1 Na/Pi symporter [Alphaproteobacteria bacterium]MBU0886875.1 Na/Pi symporter [Alphaproteobacteria bacterium]MBU1812382.1 Na/Pi symporter [Alphaproteobacteria bacterium]MBU2089848.1 Na/Pi symporter [Alphaproteobacteria bacterium]